MQACLNGTGLCTGHSTVVDGITPHKSLLFKRGMNVVTEVILPHFWVRPFCVVVSSSLWNRRSWVRISELELTRHSALQYFEKTYQGVQELAQNSPNRAHPRSAELLHLPLHPPPPQERIMWGVPKANNRRNYINF